MTASLCLSNVENKCMEYKINMPYPCYFSLLWQEGALTLEEDAVQF